MKSQKANMTTDFQCGGEWKSKVKPAGGSYKDDKSFDLKVDSSGNITGKHDCKEIISGTCSRLASGKHRMEIRREDDDNFYDYDGVITDFGADVYKILEGDGKRKITPKPKTLTGESRESKSSGKNLLADDEWVAEKGT